MGMGIHLDGVVKRFARRGGEASTVLSGVNFSCEAAEAVLVQGASGSGKSTLLNLIAGLYLPDEGEVRVGDTRLDGLSESRRDRFRADHIGYVFQTFNLLSPLSALENLVVPAALAGRGTAKTKRRAEEVLTELGLAEHQDKRPYELSVGQRQRVAVARALLHRPAVLLADEPTANLDAEAAAQVLEAMGQLQDEGTTLVIATHDPEVRRAVHGAVLDVERGQVGS